MWKKWFPWRFLIRTLAQKQGFLGPVALLSKVQRFAQPSEVAAPIELIRLATVLQARGLLNAQAIQHNLDWVWPYWVARQFNPRDTSFIPRAFSLTHINLTHRNWTAAGLPDSRNYSIVDPRGLLTPFYDGWSLDAWVIREKKEEDILPSYEPSVAQSWMLSENPVIETRFKSSDAIPFTAVSVEVENDQPVCVFKVTASAEKPAWIAIALRPFNPEGVSEVNHIAIQDQGKTWQVNKSQCVQFNEVPEGQYFSNYGEGDVYQKICRARSALTTLPVQTEITCNADMASAAAIYCIKPGDSRLIEVRIPLEGKLPEVSVPAARPGSTAAGARWAQALEGHAALEIQDKEAKFVYDAAIRTMVLHAPETDVFPGPYTYKHFWFRDAAFILHALAACNLPKRAERILDHFPSRQKLTGYFCSQEGEWDSNGQALWIFKRYCELTQSAPKPEWKDCIAKGARWIEHKRLPSDLPQDYAGLFPPGFSAEHLGPNDYYYWDDFWGVEGFLSAAYLMDRYNEKDKAKYYAGQAVQFMNCIETSLARTAKRLGTLAMPASPHRRLDTGSIGSLAPGYPLNLWAQDDARLLATVDHMLKNHFINGGFFHDMSHSGLNPYLTLMVAQILMRNGDLRFAELLLGVQKLASATGQWPEAVHPQTLGGCMGDGQHVWAAAEWALMIRDAFLREEEGRLVLCSGVLPSWYAENGEISFGKTLTPYGPVRVRLMAQENFLHIYWEGDWQGNPPAIVVWLPGYSPVPAAPQQNTVTLTRKKIKL